MKEGYIFALSLKLLIIVSSVYLIKYNQTMTTYSIYSESELVYERLAAEKEIFDEVLFRLYVYDYDDFIYSYYDYLFDVKMSETEIIINIEEPEEYVIKVAYLDDCLCFTDILYK